jgi:predicted dienelactone hydrolase
MKRFLAALLILILVTGVQTGVARQADDVPLAEPGMYSVGLQLLTFVDEARAGRELEVAILYPAIEPEDTSARDTAEMIGAPFAGFRDAEPDMGVAPYPLILYSPAIGVGAIDWVTPLNHLASHGFVVASITHNCVNERTCLVDRPLDIIFVLDELAALDDGLADTDNVGVMGLEAGGFTALAAATTGDESQPVAIDYIAERFGWELVSSWDEVAAYRAEVGNLGDDLLWPAISDERIRAILPITPALGMLYGERGLESVSVPTLIVTTTANIAVSYDNEVVPVYNNLGMDNRFLVTLIDYRWVPGGHVRWPHPREQAYYNHFALAFFGTYLQGQDAYADYLTPEAVAGYDDVAWGVRE